MKSKIFGFVASFSLVATLFFSACTNAQQNNTSTPKEEDAPVAKHLNLNFDATKMDCYDTNSKPYTSGEEVKDGDTYIFYAKLETGKNLGNWFVGNNINEDFEGISRFTYTVDTKDADENKAINIRCTIEGETKFQFDEKQIKCKKSGTNDAILNGSKVDNNATYEFTATLESGKTLASWYANGKVQSSVSATSVLTYKPNLLDANNENLIFITFSIAGETKLTFDEKEIECKKAGSTDAIQSGSKVNIAEVYEFTAKLAEGKSVSKWFVNEKAKNAVDGKKLSYTVDAKDADVNNVINVTFKELLPIRIEFDAKKIKCNRFLKNDEEVVSGIKVNVGETFTFNAEPEEGKILKHWYVNKVVRKFYDGETQFHYTVDQEDAYAQNPIVISFSEKTQELIKINFDESKLTCNKSGESKNIPSGSTVLENELYRFTAKLDDEKSIDKWFVNTKEVSATHADYCLYTIDPRDADKNNTITIRFIDKIARKVKLTFDEKSIKCKRQDSDNFISSGTMVKVGFMYSFEAQNVTKEQVEHWYVNDKQKSVLWDGETHFGYTINEKDADSNNTINVRFSKKS